uniref:Uncharacterized protein n=1 Tax=Oncorhynchus tshawytscha TaxID=74940 RepID=A0AAZ3S2Z1_ONCTS
YGLVTYLIAPLSSAWAVLLYRSQQRLQLVLLPPGLFIPVTQDQAQREESVEAVLEGAHPFIICEEITDIWINGAKEITFYQRLLISQGSQGSRFTACCVNHTTWYLAESTTPSHLCVEGPSLSICISRVVFRKAQCGNIKKDVLIGQAQI